MVKIEESGPKEEEEEEATPLLGRYVGEAPRR
jgi:hypothetical protein